MQIGVDLSVKHRHPRREALARLADLNHQALVLDCSNQITDILPAAGRIQPELAAATRHPALKRKSRGKHDMAPQPGAEAGGDFREGVTTQQAVDFFERYPGLRQRTGQSVVPCHRVRPAQFPRGGVDGGVTGQTIGRAADPETGHITRQRHKSGGGVERPGQIIGEQSQRCHAQRRARNRLTKPHPLIMFGIRTYVR